MHNFSEGAELSNQVRMPWLGLGVWKMDQTVEAINAIKYAIKIGYRSIDTAAAYANEVEVGRAVRESGVSREDLFITTKVWNADHGYESTLAAFEVSRKKLGLEYLDLYLIHWPVKGKYKETWRALEKLYREGLVRAIGVSNFQVYHLQDLMADYEIVPMVNQVEFHPLLTQQTLRDFCAKHRIQVEAWSPLMQGKMDDPTLVGIAAKLRKSPGQILLRWDLQHGVVTIPKSIHEHRILENMTIFDFELSQGDMALLDQMNQNHRFGSDPDNFNF